MTGASLLNIMILVRHHARRNMLQLRHLWACVSVKLLSPVGATITRVPEATTGPAKSPGW